MRFHDHAAVLGLPRALGRVLTRRIEQVNETYDEVHVRYGGIRLDLRDRPDLVRREYWSIDRFHPSEMGHRTLARAFAELMVEHGYRLEPPSCEPGGGIPPSWRRDLVWMVAEGAPWFGRRARDLGPWAVRRVVGRHAPLHPQVHRRMTSRGTSYVRPPLGPATYDVRAAD